MCQLSCNSQKPLRFSYSFRAILKCPCGLVDVDFAVETVGEGRAFGDGRGYSGLQKVHDKTRVLPTPVTPNSMLFKVKNWILMASTPGAIVGHPLVNEFWVALRKHCGDCPYLSRQLVTSRTSINLPSNNNPLSNSLHFQPSPSPNFDSFIHGHCRLSKLVDCFERSNIL